MSKRLFLSCASREFSHVRDRFTMDFRRPDVEVKSHEEVAGLVSGGTTLEKLDDYISGCNAVVHLLGQAAGIHLHRARLFGRKNEEIKYPWESPQADLAAAEKLINACGYHRRDQELADANRVIHGVVP